MKTPSELLSELARLVAETAPDELDCDEALDLLATYLEARPDRGENLPRELAAVEQHLRVCPDCHEEFQALLTVHETED